MTIGQTISIEIEMKAPRRIPLLIRQMMFDLILRVGGEGSYGIKIGHHGMIWYVVVVVVGYCCCYSSRFCRYFILFLIF